MEEQTLFMIYTIVILVIIFATVYAIKRLRGKSHEEALGETVDIVKDEDVIDKTKEIAKDIQEGDKAEATKDVIELADDIHDELREDGDIEQQ